MGEIPLTLFGFLWLIQPTRATRVEEEKTRYATS